MSPSRSLVALSLASAPFLCGAVAAGEEPDAAQKECAGAYEVAQERRAAGDLQIALERLRACMRPSCAEFIRKDCSTWFREVESAIPTVVFAAKREGQDLAQVRVLEDDELLLDTLDGTPVKLNPGSHRYRFETEGSEPVERELVIRVGEQNRIVRIDFQPKPEPPPAAPPPTPPPAPAAPEPSHTLPLVLGGVGVLGIGAFASFAVLGREQETDLASSCEPNCTDSQVAPVRTKYLLADISLGVGVVSLAAAAYFYFQGESEAAASTQTGWSLDVTRSPGGGVATVRRRF